jgi:hypothetical protein
MMSKKLRSVGWVVSTHVLTTGLAMPAIAALLYVAVVSFGQIHDPLLALYMQATFSVLGYVGGTQYSLSYLRKAADCDSWTRCTAPAIVTFAILNFLACGGNVYLVRNDGALAIGVVVLSYLVATAAVMMLTAQGFARMARAEAAPDAAPAESVPSRVTKSRPGGRFKRRLVAAGVGFTIGFAAGLAISIWMIRGGPPSPAASHATTGLVVGGIGALLGLISGPVKL